MSLLDKAKTLGGNLLDYAYAYGTKTYAPDYNQVAADMGEEDPAVAAAKAQYDRNYRIARQEAISKGTPWYAMGDYAAAGAQEQYGSDINQAFTAAEELRKRRAAAKAREGITDYVNRNLGDLSPEQQQLLQSLGPDASAEPLLGAIFPEAKGGANPSSVQSTFQGANGNLWIVQRDGKVRDSGVRYDATTSEQRTMLAYVGDPRLQQGAGIRGYTNAYSGKEGEAQAAAMGNLPVVLQQSQNGRAQLVALREELATLPTGVIEGPTAVLYNARFQAAQAELTQYALQNIAALQNQGVRLTPITEHELKILFDTSPQITNQSEANVKIIDRRIEALDKIIAETTAQLQWVDSGQSILQYRPKSYEAPAQEEFGVTPVNNNGRGRR